MDACLECCQAFGVFTSIDSPCSPNQIEGSPNMSATTATVQIKTFNNKISLPFSLNCNRSHLVCHTCIINKENQTIICPSCNTKCSLSQVKLDSTSFLASFKQNQASILQVESTINQLISHHQSEQNRKNLKETLSRFVSRCCHCDNKENFAEIFCSTCETIICKYCVDNHPGHIILPLGKIDFEKLTCFYHKKEKAEMFCAKEKKLICTRCLGPDGHIRHKYFSFYDSKVIRSKLVEIEQSCNKLKLKNIQELALQNETHKLVSNSNKSDDVQKARDISKKIYELYQSNVIVDSLVSEIKKMLANPDWKIIFVPSEEKNLELESLLRYYYSIASSVVEPSSLEDPLEIDQSMALKDERNALPTPQLSPIRSSSDTSEARQRIQPPKRLSNRSKIHQQNNETNLSKATVNPKQTDENNNPKYDLFTENEFNGKDKIEFKLCKFVSPEEIWLVPGLRVKILDKIVVKHLKFESQLFYSEEEAQNLSIGEVVGYKSEKNGNIYRAKITQKTIGDDGSFLFEVNGVDNCKRMTVKSDRLRKLIKDYKDLPGLKIKCCLHNLKPFVCDENNLNKKWNDVSSLVAKKWLIDHLTNISLKIINKIDDEYKVDFVAEWPHDFKTVTIASLYNLNPCFLTDVLVKYQLAVRETNDQFNFFKRNLKQPTFITMKAFNPDDQIKATVSCFNSLKGFYLKRNYEDDPDDELSKRLYKQINTEYQTNYHNYSIIAPEENLPVAALYNDNNWYRAEIIKIYPSETKVDVFFVDYGESYTVDCSQICYLKYDFLASEVSTFKCRLYGIDFPSESDFENANEHVHHIMTDLVKSENQIVDLIVKNVVQEDNGKIYEIILRYKMDEKLENLNVMLTKMGYAQCTNLSIYDGEKEMSKVKDKHILKRAPKMTKLEKSAQKVAFHAAKVQNFKPDNAILCKVINAESPDEIWIQDVVDSDQIYDKFYSSLNQHYSSLLNDENYVKSKQSWNVGELCVMKNANRNNFYRARVIEKSDCRYKLICVDTGICELATETNIFELEKEFFQPEFMAKRCTISGILPAGTSDGEWSSLAKEFTSTTLRDQYVYITFLNQMDHKHEVCIFVNANPKLGLKKEHGEEKYVKFSDVLNTEGLALISGKNSIIDKAIRERSLLLKCGQVCTGCYGYPDLPKKVHKNFQNNYQVYYDCLITEVGYENNRYFVWAMFPTLTKCLETMSEMSQCFEIFYAKNLANFDFDYLMDVLKKSERSEACVCKVGSQFYRGEILSHVAEQDFTDNTNFMVRLIDTGRVECIGQMSIFKPLEKYIEVDRLIYQITLDTDEIHFDNEILSDLKSYLLNKIVKLKITRIIDREDDEGEGAFLTGDIQLENGLSGMKQFLTGECKDFCNLDYQCNQIPQLKIPNILHKQKHLITVTWLESIGKKAWFQFVFNDNDCRMIEELNFIKINYNLFIEMQNEFVKKKSENKLFKIRLEELRENNLCCCFYQQDMQLYRGLIQHVDFLTQTAKVMYIDFGNTETIKFNHIFELEQRFRKVPVQAIEFKIQNLENISDKKLVDSCMEAEFYLDKQMPELRIYPIS